MNPTPPKSFLSHLHLIPWTALLLLFMVICHSFKLNLNLGSAMSIAAILGSLLVIVLEFLRSGDIQLKKFLWDTTLSMVSIVGGTWYMAHLVMSETATIHFVDIIMYSVILLDSWLSPINAFRTSLRNFQVGGQ